MNKKKEVRKAFRDSVFKRDKNYCRKCGSNKDIDPHHITDRNEMPNGGYVPENGITLCSDCHPKAEEFHVSKGERYVPTYAPEDLYALIGSSYEKAVAASKKL